MWDNVDELRQGLAQIQVLEQAVKAETDVTARKARLGALNQYMLSFLPMPEWYIPPVLTPVYRIDTPEPYVYKVYDPAGEVVYEAKQFLLAVEYVRTCEGDMIFTGDYTHMDPKNSIATHGFISIPIAWGKNGKPSNYQLVFSHTSEDRRLGDYRSFLAFLRTAEEYLTNPKDFLTAWSFANTHPYAWLYKNEHWVTGNNVQEFYLTVGKADYDGTAEVLIEHGEATIERTERTFDPKLTVIAPTYEEAIIQVAAVIHKFYYLDGTPRPDVVYEKSNMELAIDDAIRRLNEQRSEITELDLDKFFEDDPGTPQGDIEDFSEDK